MVRFSVLITLTLFLSACLPAASNPIEITPIVITAESGTAEPIIITDLPPDYTQESTPILPSQTPLPPLPGGLAPTQLKYRVLAEFPDFFFCDSDYYPVARDDEMALALERFPQIQANTEEFNATLEYTHLSGQTSFSDEQKLQIYREHKRLSALFFEIAGEQYRFQIQVARTEGEGQLVTGLIDAQGRITVLEKVPTFATCPICLAAGTLIDAPAGPIAVEALRPGMPVWTLDAAGNRLAAPVVQVSKTVTPASHRVVHLILDDGRELWVSPGHSTADGRRAGALRPGDVLDGAAVLSAERVHYSGAATYDLLPAGETGVYWANGVLLDSTLHANGGIVSEEEDHLPAR